MSFCSAGLQIGSYSVGDSDTALELRGRVSIGTITLLWHHDIMTE